MRGNERLTEAALRLTAAATATLNGDGVSGTPLPGLDARATTAVATWLRNQSHTWIFAYTDHLVASDDESASEEYADDLCSDALMVAGCVLGDPHSLILPMRAAG